MPQFRSEATTIGSLLARFSFEIPGFQRPYGWGRRQIDALLYDLFSEFDPGTINTSYFLGAFVLEERQGEPHRVVDGQQRLVTVSLLLALLADRGDERTAAGLNRLLLSEGRPRIRLLSRDASVYAALLRQPGCWSEPERRHHPLAVGTALIEEFLERHLAGAEDPHYVVSRMSYRCLNRCEVVRIGSGRGADAYQVFETLNERGLELGQSDLIKNKLLWSGQPEALEQVLARWQRCQTLVGDQMTRFLRHFWSAFVEPVSSRDLYDAMRRWIDQRGPRGVTLLTAAMATSAEHYQVLLDPESRPDLCPPRASLTLSFLNSLGARTCWPLILLCWRLYPQELSWLARLCEVTTVRARLVTDAVTSAALEDAYSRICRQLRERLSLSLETIESQAAGFSAIVEINQAVLNHLEPLVPDDATFHKACRELAPARVDRRWKAFLGRLLEVPGWEREWMADHILPASLPAPALKAGGLSRRQARRLVGTLGNLTLIETEYGRGKKSMFDQKRALYRSSTLRHNRELAEHERWGAAEIRERSQQLADRAVQTWPSLRQLGLF